MDDCNAVTEIVACPAQGQVTLLVWQRTDENAVTGGTGGIKYTRLQQPQIQARDVLEGVLVHKCEIQRRAETANAGSPLVSNFYINAIGDHFTRIDGGAG